LRASKAGTETYTKARFDGNELLRLLKALDMAAEMSGCGTPRPTGEARVTAPEERGAEGNGSATINAMVHIISVSREGKVRLEP
jgi:hypothetical protein